MAGSDQQSVIEELTRIHKGIDQDIKPWQNIFMSVIQTSFELESSVKVALAAVIEPVLTITKARAGIIFLFSENGQQILEVSNRGFRNEAPLILNIDSDLEGILYKYLDNSIPTDGNFYAINFGTKETESGIICLYVSGSGDNSKIRKLLDLLSTHISFGIGRMHALDIAKRRDLLAKASLVHLGKAMGSTLDIKKLARQITQAAMAISEADLCDILLLKGGTLEFQVASGFNKIYKGFSNVPLKKDPAAGIIEHGQPMVIKNIRSKSRFHERPWLSSEQFKSYIAVPIKQDDQIIGVLEAFSRTTSKFSHDDLKIFQSLAGPVAASLQNIRFFEETKRKAEKLRILHTHVSRIVAEQDIGKMMKEIVNAARAAVGSLMAAAALYNPETGCFEYRTSNIDAALGTRELSDELQSNQGEMKVTYTEEAYAEILRTGKALRLDDIKLHNGYGLKSIGNSPLRGFLGVPFLDQDKRPCGIVIVSFKEDGALFTEADEEILTTLANQASIAIQNARLYQQLEYRARGLKKLSAVSQKISATPDSKKIQKAVIKAICKLFKVKSACIALYDDSSGEFVISECLFDGVTPALKKKLIIEKEMLSALLENKRPIVARASEINENIKLDGRSIGEYFESFIGIPLIAHNRVIGLLVMSADWAGDENNSVEDRELLQIFANKVAIAIDNSRLYEEALAKAEKLSKTLEVSKVIASEVDITQVYKQIVQAIKDMFNIRHGCIYISDRIGEKLELAYKWGIPVSTAKLKQVACPEGSLVMRAFRAEKQIVIDNIQDIDDPRKAHLQLGGMRSAVIIPLVVKGKVRGVISLFSKEPKFFTDQRIDIINIFTNQFAIAIRNNQLYARSVEQEVARKEAEFSVELLKEKAKSATVIERTADGIFMIDSNFKVKIFNPALERITGKKAEQAIGEKCHDVFKEIFADTKLCICDCCPMQDYSLTGRERVRTSIRHKNGDLRYVELSHSVIDHGGRRGLIGSLRDITKDHELEIYHHDLRIATEVQKNILPQEKPDIDSLDIGFLCEPAKQIGGDYFDFILLGNDKLGIAIGDVAGKSLPAALLVSMHKYILRSAIANTRSVISPLRALNQILWEDTSPEVFITAIYGVYDETTSTFVYANAGHLPPLLYTNNATRYLWTPQTPLGIQENLFIEQQQVRLKAGDVLVLLSDGVTDMRNSRGECYGFQRLRKIVKHNAGLSAQELANLIYEKTIEFSAGDQVDDFTLVVLKCTKEGEETSEKQLVVVNKPVAVNDVRKFVSSELKRTKIAKEDISDILVAVCEAVTNCVMHGQSPDGEDNNIRVNCELKDDIFKIAITDSGIGYNPNLAEWRPPDLTRDRGRGIFIMKEFMDSVEFRLDDRGSSVFMSKKVYRER